MSALFGGKTDTGGSEAMANAQIAIDQKNRDAAAKQLSDQQANEQKTAADQQAKEQADQAAQAKQLADLQAKKAADANALATTGGAPSMQDLQQQKLAKAAAGASLGLPGFDSLQNRFGGGSALNNQQKQNAQMGGYNGQGNSLVAKKPTFQAAPGGQRFYS